MSNSNNSYRDYFKSNHRKRLVNWTLFYGLLAIFFVIFFIKQINKVNTMQFASGQLTLTMTKSKYTVGDSIIFKLTNGFNLPITLIDKCPKPWLHVYSYSNGVWNQVSTNTSANYCSTQPSQLTIKPKNSISENYNQWSSLFSSPGIYRVAILAENYPGLAYADFQVVAKTVVIKAPAPVIIYKPVYTPVYTPVYVQSNNNGGDN